MHSILTKGMEKGGNWLVFAGYAAGWSLLFIAAALLGSKPGLILAFALSVYLVFRAYQGCKSATYMQINFLMICVIVTLLFGLSLVSSWNSEKLTADVLIVTGCLCGALILPFMLSTRKRMLNFSGPIYISIYVVVGVAVNGFLYWS